MSTRDIAKKLIKYCRDQKHRRAVDELYSNDCISREMPGVPDEIVEGKAAVIAKNAKWFEAVKEFHECEVSDPIVSGDYFSCLMTLDVTFYGRKRMQLSEICVYEVANEKIVSEQFFYSAPEE